jgi:hypothetical protein
MADNTATKGFVMTPEDEEFNRVEMESRIKQENVRSMLAHPEQKPVAFYVYKPTFPRGNLGNVSDSNLPWVYDQDPSSGYSARMLVYTVPPQRTWVGLTDEEIADCAEKMEASDPTDSFWREFFRGIEAKLKEKNT